MPTFVASSALLRGHWSDGISLSNAARYNAMRQTANRSGHYIYIYIYIYICRSIGPMINSCAIRVSHYTVKCRQLIINRNSICSRLMALGHASDTDTGTVRAYHGITQFHQPSSRARQCSRPVEGECSILRRFLVLEALFVYHNCCRYFFCRTFRTSSVRITETKSSPESHVPHHLITLRALADLPRRPPT